MRYTKNRARWHRQCQSCWSGRLMNFVISMHRRRPLRIIIYLHIAALNFYWTDWRTEKNQRKNCAWREAKVIPQMKTKACIKNKTISKSLCFAIKQNVHKILKWLLKFIAQYSRSRPQRTVTHTHTHNSTLCIQTKSIKDHTHTRSNGGTNTKNERNANGEKCGTWNVCVSGSKYKCE